MSKSLSGNEAHRLRILRNRAAWKQGWRCFWCREPMEKDGDPNGPLRVSGDHHPVPLRDGGLTRPGNVVAAHRKCNSERDNPERPAILPASPWPSLGDSRPHPERIILDP